MSVDVDGRRPAYDEPAGNAPDPGRSDADLHGTLEAVRQAALDLLAEFPSRPSSLQMQVGEVAVTVTWPDERAVGEPAPAGRPRADPPGREPEPSGVAVLASTVGVFYCAPQPGAPPFVEEGDLVARGDQVGILEVMKLMIPVEAECAGRVTRIVATDGQSVEYGEQLLIIDPAGTG
nr:acetyl-CoA carboxylase biotin carboxyl carrier protein [Amycolatopsis sp.]